MKKSNIVLIIVMILLVAAGWSIQILSLAQVNGQYGAYLRQAEQFNEAELYQKAAQSYEAAFQIKDKKEIRELWLESHRKAYEDRTESLNTYMAAIETMCSLYEDDVVYWERLMTLQMDNGKVDDAYDTLNRFGKTGLSSAVIDGYSSDVLYAFNTLRKPYIEYVRNTTGYYTVKDGRGWGIVRPNGETVYDCIYQYIGPYNTNYDALFISEKGQRIADAKAIIQAKIDVKYSKTGAWVDGLLPVCEEDGSWYYLNTATNERSHGSYVQVSNYVSGVAAVFNGTEWSLVNTAGEVVSQKKFSDIKLHGNGDYQRDGIMIAAVNGEYGIYNANGDPLNDFRAADMDVYMGESIAFCDKSTGKWGMVDKDGVIAVEPAFSATKSFSNGLAAVSNGDRWGFADAAGNVVIDYQFLEADYFTQQGLCCIAFTEAQYQMIQLRFVEG